MFVTSFGHARETINCFSPSNHHVHPFQPKVSIILYLLRLDSIHIYSDWYLPICWHFLLFFEIMSCHPFSSRPNFFLLFLSSYFSAVHDIHGHCRRSSNNLDVPFTGISYSWTHFDFMSHICGMVMTVRWKRNHLGADSRPTTRLVLRTYYFPHPSHNPGRSSLDVGICKLEMFISPENGAQ